MKFDLEGRLDNMRLPDGRAAELYSVYEAVSNAQHAIDDRFRGEAAAHGQIDVEVALTDEGKLIERIVVRDNGIGLNPTNLEAFDTCDSRNKKSRGGKGIGRLIWLKSFGSVHVRSVFLDDARGPTGLEFEFALNQENTLQGLAEFDGTAADVGTQIELSRINATANVKIRSDAFIREIALHFFSQFIAGGMSHLTVTYGENDPIELNEYVREHAETPTEDVIAVEQIPDCKLIVSHIYVDRTISRDIRNSILLTGNARLVEKIEIEKKFALDQLGEGKAYVAVVSGQFLDERVDQERTGFKLTEDQHDYLVDAVMSRAEAFLSGHIKTLRQHQKVVVQHLLQEHPQLAVKVRDIDTYVKGLSPGMGEEDIGKNLFTLLYRDERRIAKEVERLSGVADLSDEARDEAQETLAQVTEQAKVRLAEYVVKRRQILNLARGFLRRDGSGKHHFEKAVHDLICPMGYFYSTEDYASHNLWIIDDLLAYYRYFASDKQIQKITKDSAETSEPDLIFFNPLGFRREGTNDPVVLVEFKRPGDEQLSSDPVDQVLGYIEKLRNKTVEDAQGQVISNIRENTPFECYIVCDLTQGARRLFARSLAPHETPDGEGFFGFAPNHKATIHVISYSKMLRDAELRNQIFFDKLGLI